MSWSETPQAVRGCQNQAHSLILSKEQIVHRGLPSIFLVYFHIPHAFAFWQQFLLSGLTAEVVAIFSKTSLSPLWAMLLEYFPLLARSDNRYQISTQAILYVMRSKMVCLVAWPACKHYSRMLRLDWISSLNYIIY